MPHIKLHVTREFEEALEALVRGKGLTSKSQAIRYAVQEAAAPYLPPPRRDFSVLEGLLDRYEGGSGKARPSMAELERDLDIEMGRGLRPLKRRRARAGTTRL